VTFCLRSAVEKCVVLSIFCRVCVQYLRVISKKFIVYAVYNDRIERYITRGWTSPIAPLLITRRPRSVHIGKHDTHPLVDVSPTLKHTSVASRILQKGRPNLSPERQWLYRDKRILSADHRGLIS